VVRGAIVAALAISALGAAGCGKASPTSPVELALEREDLVVVSRALQGLQGQSEAEVAATRSAWPLIANGLADRETNLYPASVRTAIESASRLSLPTILNERNAEALTGPAYGIASLYREFTGLASRGWGMLGASIYQIEHGSPHAAHFARSNSPLYIDAVYDAHFGLGQIGKQLKAAYAKLGGEPVFGVALTQAEADALAAAYSEDRARLQPHVGVKLGS
jgi:hypothetical protein